ncbi:hypothetical protein EVAR_71946_1 [Eumeta japonica]|uniref:BUB1 N-terminal domain-containing protein n=1 Tax=Eumeta variegata TaxID=151549 RepID=A0A4C1TNV4_EUMVA|nr:hypothetical protein EVAR_71946_1 [Eumeta japonica]
MTKDCLDPPMTSLPTGLWMCPNHVENFIESVAESLVKDLEALKTAKAKFREIQKELGNIEELSSSSSNESENEAGETEDIENKSSKELTANEAEDSKEKEKTITPKNLPKIKRTKLGQDSQIKSEEESLICDKDEKAFKISNNHVKIEHENSADETDEESKYDPQIDAELKHLDVDLIKKLAYQRLQQLVQEHPEIVAQYQNRTAAKRIRELSDQFALANTQIDQQTNQSIVPSEVLSPTDIRRLCIMFTGETSSILAQPSSENDLNQLHPAFEQQQQLLLRTKRNMWQEHGTEVNGQLYSCDFTEREPTPAKKLKNEDIELQKKVQAILDKRRGIQRHYFTVDDTTRMAPPPKSDCKCSPYDSSPMIKGAWEAASTRAKCKHLHASLQVESPQELLAQRKVLEKEIHDYNGDDPLSAWYNYIEWIEQSFPSGGKESGLQEVLSKCLARNTRKSDEIFLRGIACRATAFEELREARQHFGFSVAQRLMYKDDDSMREETNRELHERRVALTTLRSHRKHVSSVRKGSAIKSVSPGKVKPLPDSVSTQESGKSVCSIIDAARDQENQKEPGPLE